MRLIRRLVYRLGFRPRPGSIFHSPSFLDHKAYRRAVEAAIKAYGQHGKLMVIPNERTVSMSSEADLKDAVATVREALISYQNEAAPQGHPIQSSYGQLVMAVEYLTIVVGHTTNSSYEKVKQQGRSELPLTTDGGGDRIWHDYENCENSCCR